MKITTVAAALAATLIAVPATAGTCHQYTSLGIDEVQADLQALENVHIQADIYRVRMPDANDFALNRSALCKFDKGYEIVEYLEEAAGDPVLLFSTEKSVLSGESRETAFTTDTTLTDDLDEFHTQVTGMKISFEPQILQDGRIKISYFLNMMVSTIGDSKKTFQLQTTTTRLGDQIIIQDGESLVQTAYQTLVNVDNHSDFWIPSYPNTQVRSLETYVVVLQAKIDRPT